ncbi:rRNA maturation RNase YbeY [bacterium]|nr:rRNA maturation RNase YbeY [bacterium]
MDPHHLVMVRQGDVDPSQRWPLSFLRSVVRTTLRLAPCPEDAELSLTLTTDRGIQDLNARYRGLDKPTDVLAFAMEDGEPLPLLPGVPRQLGDIVVSLDTTLRQAQENQTTPQSELAWVICHGTLHLLGFDHQDFEQLSHMRAREREVLTALAIDRNWPELYPEET